MLANRLGRGGTVGIVAPSSPVTPETEAQLEKGVAFLRGLGLEVVVGRNVRSTSLGYCASPEEKAADINQFFADRSVAGIICAQGGATANACLPHLSWPTIRANPKVFTGMSDNTVLLNAIHARTGLVTFHAPDLMWGLGREPSEYDCASFVGTLIEGRLGAVPANRERKTVRGGCCKGVALGGNLRCLLKLAGTPYFPDMKGAVLFLEAVDVSSETCDFMLEQLRQMGVLGKAVGVVVGHINGLQDDTEAVRMEGVLERITDGLALPILKTDDFGHDCANAVVPIGAAVHMDADRLAIEFREPVVI